MKISKPSPKPKTKPKKSSKATKATAKPRKAPAPKAPPRTNPKATQIDPRILAAYDSDTPPVEITCDPGPLADLVSILQSASRISPIMNAILLKRLGVWKGPLPRNPYVDPWDIVSDLAEKLFDAYGGQRAVEETKRTVNIRAILQGAEPEITRLFEAIKTVPWGRSPRYPRAKFPPTSGHWRGKKNELPTKYKTAALAEFDSDPDSFHYVQRQHLDAEAGDLFCLFTRGQERRDFRFRLLQKIVGSQLKTDSAGRDRLQQVGKPPRSPREILDAIAQRLGIDPREIFSSPSSSRSSHPASRTPRK